MSKSKVRSLMAMACVALTAVCSIAAVAEEAKKAPFPYVWGKAYHILPGTHNNESGYFSLVEGKNGKLYIGTAKYGENSYLVEFDPQTEKQRIVIDTHKLTGATGKGFAAQSKIHTKNFVGPSGIVYVGSKEGYPDAKETAVNDIAPYPGGYVMTYDPRANKARNLGMPWPGQGIGDVVADEARGLLYIVTCEDEFWMTYDTKTKRYRWLGPRMFKYASTLVDGQGRANSITSDWQFARYDPSTNKLSVQPIMLDGKKWDAPKYEDRTGWIPSWIMTPDGKTAYLIRMSHPELYKVDLTGEMDKPVVATTVARMVDADNSDCRSGLSLGPDGKVYAAIAVLNKNTYGPNYQFNKLTRYDPATGKVEDFGVMAVQNKNYFDFQNAMLNGKKNPFTNGFQTLPDGTLSAQYQHLGSIVARDGTVYVLLLSPYTLLRIPPSALKSAS